MVTTVCMNPSFDKTAAIGALRLGEVNRLKDVRLDPGGKGLNVAIVLARLGVDAQCVGCLGEENADEFRRLVEKENVRFEAFPLMGKVRTNMKLYDETEKKITEFNEPGPVMTEEQLESFVAQLARKAAGSSYVVMSGRPPQGCKTDVYQRCMHELPQTRCVLDAAGETLLNGVKERPYLIKPNLPELEEIVCRELKTLRAIRDAAMLLMEYGAQNVIVSMGKMGAVLVTPQKTLFSPAVPVEARSTVGAGDAMVGGLLMALEKGRSLEDSFRFGVAAGAASVMTDGTQLVDPKDFEALTPRVTVQEV